MGANMQKMMKQMQQMQNKMNKLQEELAQTPVEATAGGGVVKVVVNGANEVLAVEINPEVLDPDDPEMVQDLVMAAALRNPGKERGNLQAGRRNQDGLLRQPYRYVCAAVPVQLLRQRLRILSISSEEQAHCQKETDPGRYQAGGHRPAGYGS